MGKEFKRDKIKNICRVFSGATPSTNNTLFWNGDILWITPNDLSKLRTPYFSDTERKITNEGLISCSTHLMPAGTLVMSSRAPIGYLAISEKEFTTNQGCKSFAFYDNYDSLYFYYCLQNQVATLKVLGEGTTFAELSKSYIEEFELAFPENKSEQRAIASILKTIDESIIKTATLIEKYQSIKTGLMQDLLTKGIDAKGEIRTKATHKFDVKNGIEIPEEWEVKKIINTTYLKARIGWQGLKASEFIADRPFLVTGTDFINGLINWDTSYHVSEERFREAKYIHLRNGDLVITKDGTIGKTALIKNCPEKAVLNSGVFVMRCSDNSYLNEFMYYILNSKYFDDFLFHTQGGSTINHLYQREFEKFYFPCPNLIEQERIISILNQVEESIKAESNHFKKLSSKKIGLMQDLLSGKVRVN